MATSSEFSRNFVISLTDLRFYSRIGVGEQERRIGNEFRVDVSFSIDAAGFRAEDISTTVSYADAYDVIAAQMGREWLLLESVAEAVAEALCDSYPVIKSCKVSITKLSVPVAGIDGRCGVEYSVS